MKLIRRTALVAVLVAVAALVGCQGSPPSAVATSTTVKCGLGTISADTDWYLPPGSPKGLVWLQHGFTESKTDWGSFAPQLAAAGYVVFVPTLPTANIYGCTVENIGNNTDFLDNVAALFATAGDANGPLATSFAAATKAAGRTGLALPTATTFVGHSAGGEDVLYVANQLRSASPATFAHVRGVVLADPVKSFIGNNTDAALAGLAPTPLPVEAIASPSYSCNGSQSGTVAVEQDLAARAFHGVQVTTGSHPDIFGTAANSLETATCGTPQVQNTSAVQTLALAWLNDDTAGTHTAADYPGGSTYQALVTAGTITTLP